MEFKSHIWAPITDVPEDWSDSLKNDQTSALVQVWNEQQAELREKELYKNFLSKLQRQWAIETGVIEGLYSISEGATKVLIEKGIDAALLSNTETNDDPERVVAKIKDHQQAIDGLYAFVSGERSLGTSYIKELHSVLTANQPTYVGRDTLGNTVIRDLPRGIWKNIPNNVEHPDGSTFEYCPPDHVAQEMEHLVSMYHRQREVAVPADIQAAWLHHRFTIIHPFVDGNGRVARCLATLVLLRDNWLPPVITRDNRSHYIDALRIADDGNLKPFVDLIGLLQRRAIREALSLSDQVIHESQAIAGILESVKEKFNERRAAHRDKRKQAITTADSLQLLVTKHIEKISDEVTTAISSEDIAFRAYAVSGERNSDRVNYYYHQIGECAKKLGYFANLNVYRSWSTMVIQANRRAEILFSFHGIGHQSSGVIGCAAMFFTKERDETGESVHSDLEPLETEPFEFTYTEEPTAVQQRFRIWQDKVLLLGLERWQQIV